MKNFTSQRKKKLTQCQTAVQNLPQQLRSVTGSMKSENTCKENFMTKVEHMLAEYAFFTKNQQFLAREQMSLRLKSRTDDDMGKH